MTEIKQITQKIVAYKVNKAEEAVEERFTKVEWETKFPRSETKIGIHENVKRELCLSGSTYKICPANENHSYYITINHQEIDGIKYPFELFISSRSVEHTSWISALSRMISAVWRKGGETSFVINELTAIHDNKGYWGRKDSTTGKKKWYNSVIAEIGEVIGKHIEGLNDTVSNIPLEKVVAVIVDTIIETINEDTSLVDVVFPANAQLCPECYTKALIKIEGCNQCLNCNYSKCN